MKEEIKKNVTESLLRGRDEQEIIREYDLSFEELYGQTDYFKGSTWAREKLKNYCKGCANGICFSWPLVDEKYCPVGGYKPSCPLQVGRSG